MSTVCRHRLADLHVTAGGIENALGPQIYPPLVIDIHKSDLPRLGYCNGCHHQMGSIITLIDMHLEWDQLEGGGNEMGGKKREKGNSFISSGRL